MMILDVLTFVFLFLAFACEVASLVCILLDKNDTCIPTLVSFGGIFAYLLFLACACRYMDSFTQFQYFALVALFAVVSAATYFDFKRTERMEQEATDFYVKHAKPAK